MECGLVTRGVAPDDAAMLVKNWLEVQHNRPWLMVLDNVDDKDAFFHEKMRDGRTPSQSIPRCEQGCLLFTTRTSDMAYDLATPATPVAVDVMNEEEGIRLLKSRLPNEVADDVLYLELLQELDYIPLAITQAIAYMIKRRRSVSQYLEQYRSNEETRTRLISYEVSEHGRQERSFESIAKTWIISFEWIYKNNQRAAQLLYLISFLQHQSIPRLLLRNNHENELDFEEAVGVLRSFSLIDNDDTETTFETHRLVQLVTRSWLQMQSPDELEKRGLEALHSVASRFPRPLNHPQEDYFKTCEILLPHADLVLRYEFRQPSREAEVARARVLDFTGRYSFWTGDSEECRNRLQASLAIKQKYLGEDHIDTMDTMERVVWAAALAYDEQQVNMAVKLGTRLLELHRIQHGEDHPNTIDCLSNLAVAICRQGDKIQAKKLHQQAVDLSTRVLGPQHLDTLNCKTHLATVLHDLGELDQAIWLQREVYETSLREIGHEHRLVLVHENNLAWFLFERGDLDEALALSYHAFGVKRKILGSDHASTLASGDLTAWILRRQGKLLESEDFCGMLLAEAQEGPRRHTKDTRQALGAIREMYTRD